MLFLDAGYCSQVRLKFINFDLAEMRLKVSLRDSIRFNPLSSWLFSVLWKRTCWHLHPNVLCSGHLFWSGNFLFVHVPPFWIASMALCFLIVASLRSWAVRALISAKAILVSSSESIKLGYRYLIIDLAFIGNFCIEEENLYFPGKAPIVFLLTMGRSALSLLGRTTDFFLSNFYWFFYAVLGFDLLF